MIPALPNKMTKLFRHRGSRVGFSILVVFFFTAIFAPWIAPYEPSTFHEGATQIPPFWSAGRSPAFVLGTDDIGRDFLSRLVYGARVSLGIGCLVVLIASVIGTLLGLVAGYFEGKVDQIIMRGTEILMAMPSILLAIVVVSVLGPGLFNTILAISVVSIPNFVRVVRASVLQEKSKDYVMSVRSLGAGHVRILFQNILPNCMAPLIVQASLGFSDGILNAAALGFLGLGAQPPTPEWGAMLADSRAYIESAPYLVTLPGLCILFVVLAFNLLGDGLRDVLDPKLK